MKKIFFLFLFIFNYSYANFQAEGEKHQKDSLKINGYVKLMNTSFEKKTDSSEIYYKQALEFSNTKNLKKQLALALLYSGYDYEDALKYNLAIYNYEKSAECYHDLNEFLDEAIILNYIGYCYLNSYRQDKAIEYYFKSLKISESMNDAEGIATNFLDLGNLYFDQENYEFARKYYQDALTIYERLNDNSGIAICYTNMGNIEADNGNMEEGLDFYKQSIILEEELNDLEGIASNYNNIGDCYIQLKDYSKAQFYFNEALEIGKKIKSKSLQELVYLNIGDLKLQEKKYNSAILNANKSIEISLETKNLPYQLDNYLTLALSYEGLNDISNSLNFYKKYTQIKDSISVNDKKERVKLFNTLNELEESNFTISELSNKNEIAKIKIENDRKISYFLISAIIVFALLIVVLINQQTSKKKAYNLLEFKNYQIQRMNVEIEKQRDYLKQLNATKDKFFSIIAHDLKNPFNSIKGFTELMIENNKEYDESKRLKFLRIVKDSTNKASVLLNNLLVWANSQSGNLNFTPQKIELVRQVMDVVSLLEIQAIKKEIEIYNNVDHNLSVKADQNMLNTILRNLISNAIKFTNVQGEIKILSTTVGDMAEITVKDNGVGMSQEDIDSLFILDKKNTNVGTANESGSGLGLILCKEFINKHGGEIHVTSELNKGSEFKFTLPIWEDDLDSDF